MNGIEFKQQFLKLLPEVPKELEAELKLGEFLEFNAEVLETEKLNEIDIKFLIEGGLPCEAAPFLNFNAYTTTEITELRNDYNLKSNYFPLGHDGSGNPIVIDKESNEIIYLDHDNNMNKVLINSSLPFFAESLCLYQKNWANKSMLNCLKEIEAIDPSLKNIKAMWFYETKVDRNG